MTPFADAIGMYLGLFEDQTQAPAGSVPVPAPPPDISYRWNGTAWAKTTVLKSTVMARVIAANKMAQAQTTLWANPNQFARWFAPDQPLVNCNDPDTVAFITSLGLDPAVILAP